LMQLVLANKCEALQKLHVSNKFTAHCVYNLGTAAEQRQMKTRIPQIDFCPLEARVNLGFKASLFWETWASLGASQEEKVYLTEVTQEQFYECHHESVTRYDMPLYALPIPPDRANCKLGSLGLRANFHMHAIAMETEDGIDVRLGRDTELVKGATLWVTFELQPSCLAGPSDKFRNAAELVRRFLEYEKHSVLCRRIPCSTFPVSHITEWVGKTIQDTEMRARHNVNALGTVRLRYPGVAPFPSPGKRLFEDTLLLVLPADVPILKELQDASNQDSESEVPSVPSSHSGDCHGLPLQPPPTSPHSLNLDQEWIHQTCIQNTFYHFKEDADSTERSPLKRSITRN